MFFSISNAPIICISSRYSTRKQSSSPLCHSFLLYLISLSIAFAIAFIKFYSSNLICFSILTERPQPSFAVGDNESTIKAFREGLNNYRWDASSTFLSLSLMARKNVSKKHDSE